MNQKLKSNHLSRNATSITNNNKLQLTISKHYDFKNTGGNNRAIVSPKIPFLRAAVVNRSSPPSKYAVPLTIWSNSYARQ